MQHCKNGDFNPLDILATAAALKQVDKPEKCSKQKIVIVKPKDGAKIIASNYNESPSKGEDKNLPTKKSIGLIKTTSFVEDGVKKIKLTISPELEKMLNEHNYGSVQKINTGNKSILKLPDVLSLSKDKKVVVKVIDKSSGHVIHDKLLTGVNKRDKNSPEVKETNQDKVIGSSDEFRHKQRIEDSDCLDNPLENIKNEESTIDLNDENDYLQTNDLKEEIKPVDLEDEKDDLKINDIQVKREDLNTSDLEVDLKQQSTSYSTSDLEENLKQQSTSYSMPICKPVPIDDFDVGNERIDIDIRSPAYEDVDFNDGKTTPNEHTSSISNPYHDQSLKINLDDKDVVLTDKENSISTQTDKQNKILEKDGENQYSDNETIPGKIDTGANNTDRCDMGKSKVLEKIQTSHVQEKLNSVQNNSEGISCFDGNPSVSFLMHDHEYAGRYCDDSSEGKNDDSISDLPINSDLSQDSGFSDAGLSPDGLESRTFKQDSPSLIPVQTEMLPSFDLSDVNKARDAIVALVSSKGIPITHKENTFQNSSIRTSPKIGKFSIGTFASVCNSSLGLESPEKGQVAFGQRIATSLLSNNVYSQNSHKSATVTVVQNLIEYIEHDHDYSLPYQRRPANIPFSVQKVNKEITSKGKTRDKKSDTNEKRSKRSNSSEEVKEDKLFDVITGEHEKKGSKADKLADFLKNSTSDSKLKIQGSYRDDFVYFLNTNFRSRRRASQDVPAPLPHDKILVPLPKPGDIVVPHLTNEDLEAIKQGKHRLLPASRNSSSSSTCIPFSISTPNSVSTTKISSPKHTSNTNAGGGSMSDMESKIINTILSMENEPCADSADNSGLFNNGNDSFGINFSDQLTPEQMELLYSAVDQVQSIDDVDTKSGEHGDRTSTSSSEMLHCTDKTSLPDPLKTGAEELIKAPSEKVPEIFPNKDAPVIPVSTDGVLKHKESSAAEQLDIFDSDIKLFPETPSESSTINTSEQANDSAPWIVTVSMYWNDLPAIMLENLPYLRLVDIHKQILPAKDTGILKKRCQLLGIEVKNCTEMQRYFLVQYGRAFNSKSNLIISKEDAEALIGYYVNPVSKLPRSDDHRPKNKITKVSRSRSKVPSNIKSCKQKNAIVQKTPPAVLEPPVQKPLGRTRHKKINFLEMLKGDSNNNSSDGVEHQDQKSHRHDTATVIVVEPPAGWKKSDSTSSIKKSDVNKKNLKRSNLVIANTSKKAEECQTIDTEGDSEVENVGTNTNLTWLSKKRQRLSLKVNRKPKKPGTLKVKWTIFNKSNRKKWTNKKNRRDILSIVHKDTLSNNGQINNIQPGNVFMDSYNNENSPCVKCCTCNKVFSVDAFMAHLHDNSGDRKLVSITTPQVLSLRDTSDSQKKMWQNFQLKRKQFSSNKSELQPRHVPQIQTKNKDFNKLSRTVNSVSDKSVRISSRKRKQKQLYPIENYSYCSTVRCDGEDTCIQPLPAKMVKVSSNIFEDNVVTESNGPILTSFTALEHDV